MLNFLKIIIILTINTFLIYNNLSCLPIDLISKILETMKDNPSKSGIILQLIYFCIIAYYEVPTHFETNIEETKIEFPEKINEKKNETL